MPAAKPSAAVTSLSTAAAAAATLDCKHKASVFSQMSFPEEATNKKRKVLSSSMAASATKGGASTSLGHHHKAMSNGYYRYYDESYKGSSKAVAAMKSGGERGSSIAACGAEYELSDEDRHFKRKPSRYKPSLPPRVEQQDEPSPRHSRT